MPFRTNVSYRGDWAKILPKSEFFPDESIDLIYQGPPFLTSRDHEIIWNDGPEVRAFEGRWRGWIENYVDWMEPKVLPCERVLKSKGSLDYVSRHRLPVSGCREQEGF